MEDKLDYLLRYVSNNTFHKVILNKNSYILELLANNYIDVNLNIKYLINYGITDIEKVVCNWLEELTINHNTFVKKINNYEKYLTKEEIISLYENV